jgi:hypothetical protein
VMDGGHLDHNRTLRQSGFTKRLRMIRSLGHWMTKPSTETAIGWKVMQYDPKTQNVIAGSDSRIRRSLDVGKPVNMPGQGIWLSLDRDYVLTYYRGHDHEVLLQFEFDPQTLIKGNLTDRETEFSVPHAILLSYEILPQEDWTMKNAWSWIIQFLTAFHDNNPPAMHVTHALVTFIYACIWSSEHAWEYHILIAFFGLSLALHTFAAWIRPQG